MEHGIQDVGEREKGRGGGSQGRGKVVKSGRGREAV